MERPSVILQVPRGLLNDILRHEIERDSSLQLAVDTEALASLPNPIVIVALLDDSADRVLACIRDGLSTFRVIAIGEHPFPGQLYRIDVDRVASNASPSELMNAVHEAARNLPVAEQIERSPGAG